MSATDEGFILNWSCVDFELFWSEWTQSLYKPCSQKRELINDGVIGFNIKNQRHLVVS